MQFLFQLCRDNIPTITLGEWPLEADYIEDDVLSGIKPILFADDPKVSEAAILADPATALKDLDRLNRSFFIPETIELDDAYAIVRKPRLGEAEFYFKNRNLERLQSPTFFSPPRGNKHKYLTEKEKPFNYISLERIKEIYHVCQIRERSLVHCRVYKTQQTPDPVLRLLGLPALQQTFRMVKFY